MEFANYQQVLDQTHEAQNELKAKIIKLQSYEQAYKHHAKQVNYTLTYPNQFQQSQIEQLISYQELEFNKLMKVFNTLNSLDQRPYIQLIQHYKYCISEHRELLSLLDNDYKFIQKAKQSKQINQQLFTQYLQSLSWKYFIRGMMVLIGSFIVHLIIGASSRWNMLNIYITSFYKITKEPYLIVTEDSYVSPLSLFCMGLGMRAGLRLGQSLGTIYTCILSIVLASASLYISSAMPTFESYVLFAFVLYPLFTCLSFQLVISQCFSYYPKYRLVINGFLLMGTGLGHVLFGLINNHCFNPEDIDSNRGYYGGDLDFIARQVPHCMKESCYIVLFFGAIAIALMYPAVSFNLKRKSEARLKKGRLDFQHACASQKQALKSKIFWIMVLMIICSTCSCYFLITNFRALVSKYYKKTLDLASILLGFNLGNALSRGLWDFLFTKIGFKWCMVIVSSLNAINMGTIHFVLQQQSLYRLYYILGGICLGGCMVCFLNFGSLVFGEYVSEQLPGYIWTGYSLANLLQYAVFNSYDLANVGFLPSCLALSCINILCLIVVVRTKLQGNWENSLNLLELKCCFN